MQAAIVEFLKILWLVLKNLPLILEVLPVVARVVDDIMCKMNGDCEAIAASPEIARSIRKGQIEHFHRAVKDARNGNLSGLAAILKRHKVAS
jgi:hypothetical protein